MRSGSSSEVPQMQSVGFEDTPLQYCSAHNGAKESNFDASRADAAAVSVPQFGCLPNSDVPTKHLGPPVLHTQGP